jgi:hypothetical protein
MRPAEWEVPAVYLPVPKSYELPTGRTRKGWTTEKTMRGQSLGWSRLTEVYLEVDDNDDDDYYYYGYYFSTCSLVSWGGVRPSPLATSVTNWPIVPAPDDTRRWGAWSDRWDENWQRKPKYLEKTWPSATLSTTNPTWPDPGSNPGRLSYGTAFHLVPGPCKCASIGDTGNRKGVIHRFRRENMHWWRALKTAEMRRRSPKWGV